MSYDITARRIAREAAAKAEALEQNLSNLSRDFRAALSRIATLEAEVKQLKSELAPKVLDKPSASFPLEKKK